jgi:hypothetical protein
MAEGTSNATRGSRQLVDVVLQQASARTINLDFKQVVSIAPFRRWLILGSVSALGALAVAAATWPASAALLERICLLNIPLPTKTVVVPITGDLIVPLGSDVEISAQAKGIVPERGRVFLTYAGTPAQEIPISATPDKPDVFSYVVRNVQKDFKYQFYLNDGHGAEFSVTGKVPPNIGTVDCLEVYPGYTKLPPQKLESSDLSLLAGSHLKIQTTASEPVKSATVILQGVPQKIPMTVDGSGTKLEADIPIPAKDLTGFSIHLEDSAGVSSANEAVYPIVLVLDEPPVIKVSEPAGERETITLRAKPDFVFEASDDYGLSKLALKYELVPPPVAGQEAPPALPVVEVPIELNSNADNPHYEFTLNIALQNPPWKEGWTVRYWIEATDNNTATGPGITRSDRKSFLILTPEAKQAEILKRIKDNAAALDDLSDTQQKVSNDTGEAAPQK